MTKSIPLTRGKVVLVDDCDYDELSKYKWHVHTNGYARRSYWDGIRNIHPYMHREILGVSDGMVTDHIDHNILNNCRSNLRVCTNSQNQANEIISKNNKSGYKGVYFRTDTNKWSAQIMVNRAHVCLGSYDTAEDAHIAYQSAAQKYFGEFAHKPGTGSAD